MQALKALTHGQVAPFVDFLGGYLKRSASYYDTKGKAKEQFFHGIVLGLVAYLERTHLVESNRESGKERYDITLTPKQFLTQKVSTNYLTYTKVTGFLLLER